MAQPVPLDRMAAARLLAPAEFIAQLPPTRRLLGLVCVSPRNPPRFGVAVSDPYLSCAQPLFLTNVAASALEELIAPNDIGGVALLEPMLLDSARDSGQPCTSSAAVAAATFAATGSPLLDSLPHTHWPTSLTRRQAEDMAAENSLWADVGLLCDDPAAVNLEVDPGVQAAVMLQHLLDEECGGWANTFG
jgi:hypothetical protein